LSLRGGQNHQHIEFIARSCFQFSSILLPPMLTQDRNRMWIGELDTLRGEKAPDMNPLMMRELGQKLLRRIFDGWKRLPQSVEMYRACLAEQGHSARGCDVFGTLLACADLVLYDEETDADSAKGFAEKLAAADIAETTESGADHERFRQHLLSIALPLDAPNKATVAEWIARAWNSASKFDVEAEDSHRLLGRYGMRVVKQDNAEYLAIANISAGLSKALEGSRWYTKPGIHGVWVQTVRRLPGRLVTKSPILFAGAPSRATLIPIELVLDPSKRTMRQGALDEEA
jgi:hypothetical protein